MRTTLTLDPDVAEKLKKEAALSRNSLKAVVNTALRRGLRLEPLRKRRPYRVKAHSSSYLGGIDSAHLNRLVDDLDVEARVDAESKKSG